MKKKRRKIKDCCHFTANVELQNRCGASRTLREARSGDCAHVLKVTVKRQTLEEERQWDNALSLFVDALVRQQIEGRSK